MVFILAQLGSPGVSGPHVAVHIIYVYFLGTVRFGVSLPYLLIETESEASNNTVFFSLWRFHICIFCKCVESCSMLECL